MTGDNRPIAPNLGDDYEPCMDISAKPGTVVRFRAGGGYEWEKKRAMEAGFVLNALYTVKRCDIGHSTTEVLIDGMEGRWNSCLFADIAKPAGEPISDEAVVRWLEKTGRISVSREDYLSALAAAPAPSAKPAGEPSDDDIRAGVRAFQSGHNGFDDLSDWRAFYREVSKRAAAPAPAEPAAPVLMGWIDTKDRLPTHIYSVLGFVTSGPYVVYGEAGVRDIVIYNPKSGEWQQHDGEKDVVVTVSHWQDLPDNPGAPATKPERLRIRNGSAEQALTLAREALLLAHGCYPLPHQTSGTPGTVRVALQAIDALIGEKQ